MSIEQTSQLISLILNSVLMTLLSAALLGAAWLRQNGLCLQLQQVQTQYRRLTHQQSAVKISTVPNGTQSTQAKNQLKADLKKVRDQRQRLIGQYRWSYTGMLLLQAVLLVFGVSLLALALRSLFLIDGLISTALVLFALGVVGLLAGTSCILIDLAQGNSSDPLSYSLAKILTQISQQLSRQLSRKWPRSNSQVPSKPITPLSLSTSTQTQRLPGSMQKPDSLIN